MDMISIELQLNENMARRQVFRISSFSQSSLDPVPDRFSHRFENLSSPGLRLIYNDAEVVTRKDGSRITPFANHLAIMECSLVSEWQGVL
jgi:hypothetical protein